MQNVINFFEAHRGRYRYRGRFFWSSFPFDTDSDTDPEKFSLFSLADICRV